MCNSQDEKFDKKIKHYQCLRCVFEFHKCQTSGLLVNLELMKNGYPPIDIKFTDRVEYYKAFDEYHVNNNIGAMENLFARYIKERLDMYLNMLK